jgi:hypothetical protein
MIIHCQTFSFVKSSSFHIVSHDLRGQVGNIEMCWVEWRKLGRLVLRRIQLLSLRPTGGMTVGSMTSA